MTKNHYNAYFSGQVRRYNFLNRRCTGALTLKINPLDTEHVVNAGWVKRLFHHQSCRVSPRRWKSIFPRKPGNSATQPTNFRDTIALDLENLENVGLVELRETGHQRHRLFVRFRSSQADLQCEIDFLIFFYSLYKVGNATLHYPGSPAMPGKKKGRG